jgi:uncharacterized membrane protein YdjX (TVP38/TMEM64 family)
MLKRTGLRALFLYELVAGHVVRMRALLGGITVASLFAGLLSTHMLYGLSFTHIKILLANLHGLGFTGMMLFGIILVAIALSGIVPGSLIGILAGSIYGLSIGFLLSTISTLLGAIIAFLLARLLLRPLVTKLLAKRVRLQDFDKALARDGWRFVCLLRISPAMPFAITSYALGVSSVTMKNYLLGTLGALPALLGYVIVGTIAKAGFSAATHRTDLIRWLVIGVGLVATIFLTWRLGRLAASVGLVSDKLFGGSVYLDGGAKVCPKGD